MVFGQTKESFDRPWITAAEIVVGSAYLLKLSQTIAWVKSISLDSAPCRGHVQPIRGHDLFNYSWEPVFQFVRYGASWPLDRLAVGVPFADKKELKRGGRGKNGDLRCAGDAWFVPYETTGKTKKKDHRHAFPVALAKRLIMASGIRAGSTVLDPFCGGGTTARAAAKLGMNFYGIDKDPRAVVATRRAWKEALER